MRKKYLPDESSTAKFERAEFVLLKKQRKLVLVERCKYAHDEAS
jgi:hypothetical protein